MWALQILKSRDHNIEEFLRQMEANKGILGYTSTQVCPRVTARLLVPPVSMAVFIRALFCARV